MIFSLILGLFFTTGGAGAAIAENRVQLSTGNYRFVVPMFANNKLTLPVLWRNQCLGLRPTTIAKAWGPS